MIGTYPRYMIVNLLIALTLGGAALAAVVFLTQSLRFLELVMEVGAAGSAFWTLTALALPRFFEIILPIALAGAVLFVTQRMLGDSEVAALRASGLSPMDLARPALLLSVLIALLLYVTTTWLAPTALRSMVLMQDRLRAEISTLLLQPGVFNRFGDEITVFIQDRSADGELLGLMIHDKRPENRFPVTVTARRGVVAASENGTSVVVYDGSRQDYNPQSRTVNRLDFERYAIELPSAGPMQDRWREPDERTLWGLLSPDLENSRDVENLREFRVEVHKRMLSPLLAPTFSALALAFLLLGPHQRSGATRRIVIAAACIIGVQALYLSGFNLARQSDAGLAIMYLSVFGPLGASLFMLSSAGDKLRQKLLYTRRPAEL